MQKVVTLLFDLAAFRDILHDRENVTIAGRSLEQGGGDRQTAIAAIPMANRPFLGLDIIPLAHRRHAGDRPFPHLRVGVQRLVPTESVNFRLGITGHRHHLGIPDGELDERIVGNSMANAQPLRQILHNQLPERIFRLECSFRCFAFRNIAENPLHQGCALDGKHPRRDLNRLGAAVLTHNHGFRGVSTKPLPHRCQLIGRMKLGKVQLPQFCLGIAEQFLSLGVPFQQVPFQIGQQNGICGTL